MWVIPAKRACYGNRFPDVTRLEPNQHHAGAVFGCRPSGAGDGPGDSAGAGAGAASVTFTVDEANWERCVDCAHYRSCYDLSMAKLLFAQAAGAAAQPLTAHRTREGAAT